MTRTSHRDLLVTLMLLLGGVCTGCTADIQSWQRGVESYIRHTGGGDRPRGERLVPG